MRLILKKDQAEVKIPLLKKEIIYTLSAKVELHESEIELMNKYKLKDEELFIIEKDNKKIKEVTISMLTTGWIINSEDIFQLLETERKIIDSCKMFKANIEMRKNFCGERIIDF